MLKTLRGTRDIIEGRNRWEEGTTPVTTACPEGRSRVHSTADYALVHTLSSRNGQRRPVLSMLGQGIPDSAYVYLFQGNLFCLEGHLFRLGNARTS